MYRSFKYPLHPTKEQSLILENWLKHCCWLYNGALEERISFYKKYKKGVSRFDQQKSLAILRSEDKEWEEIPSNVLRSALHKIDLSYKAFFRRFKNNETPGYPRFKAQNKYNTFSLMDKVKVIDKIKNISSALIKIPKMGLVKFNQYRPIKGDILDILIKRSNGGWFVIFRCDAGILPNKNVNINNSTGLDLGLSSFVTFSDGSKIDNPRFFKKSQDILSQRNRKLINKRSGSKSKVKIKKLIQKINTHIKNQRLDFVRKTAKLLFNKYDIICFENLKINEMVKTGYLAKSIYDVGWSKFTQALECKAEEAGKLLIGVDPKGTSQKCSGCEKIVLKDLAVRIHDCPYCGLIMDRDQNAALNIKTLGLSVVSDLLFDKNNKSAEINYF